ncbi:PrsW family intramembrane metalloprotease [Nocardiopsis coralliicola]
MSRTGPERRGGDRGASAHFADGTDRPGAGGGAPGSRRREDPGSSDTPVPLPRDEAAGGSRRRRSRQNRRRRSDGSPLPRGASGLAVLLLVLASAVGAVLLVVRWWPAAAALPWSALTTLVVSAAALVLGAALLARLRPVRPPHRIPAGSALVWGVLAVGGIAPVAAASATPATPFTAVPGTPWSGGFLDALAAVALIACGAVLIAVAAPRALSGPLDGFVAGSLAGIGAQAAGYAAGGAAAAASPAWGQGAFGDAMALIGTILLTGLGGSWATGAVAGTAVGLLAAASWRPNARRAWAALLLLVLAVGAQWMAAAAAGGPSWGALLAALTVFALAMVVSAAVRIPYRSRIRHALASQGAALDLERRDAMELADRSGRREALLRVPGPERKRVAARQEKLLAAAEEAADQRT